MNKTYRKLRKLVRDPKLYFKDYFEKRKNKKNPTILNSFSIVTCNYNNSEYIDDFFKSFIFDFKNYEEKLEVIVVDDCSTDNSIQVIKKWVSKYPQTIKLIQNKENKGVSASRNIGLDVAEKQWVSFIDIDDFFSEGFFCKIDAFISKTKKNLGLIFLPVTEYYPNEVKKEHPLNYRFSKRNETIIVKDFKDITQSSTTTFFRRDLIEKSFLRFDERIKTTFEDGKFELEFMLRNQNVYLGLFNDGRYYYRKKLTANSISHSAWTKKEKYTTDLKYGFEVLDQYSPTLYLQKKCLYEIFWYIKFLLNKPVERFVENEEIERTFQKIFNNIPELVIKEYNKCGCWTPYKIGMFGRFKGKAFPWHCCYVEELDEKQSEIKVAIYYYYEEDIGKIFVNGKECKAIHKKSQINSLFGKPLYFKKISWIQFKEGDSLEYREPGGKETLANINCGKQTKRAKFSYQEIVDNLKKPIRKRWLDNLSDSILRLIGKILGYDKAWLFMDRDIWADDSAEVLYKWIWENKKEYRNKIFFSVKPNTKEYIRLEKLGVNLIPFNSIRYKSCLNSCEWFISSQADSYQIRGNRRTDLKYAFLQHGIIKDDISRWLNPKKFTLFVTSTEDEYEYVAGDGPFKFTSKEVKLIGLPRHDLLVDRSTPKGQIVIMPTWRKSLSIDSKTSNEKFINKDFYTSEFANTWKKLLHNPVFKELADKGVKLVFCPHVNLTVYLDWFELPEYFSCFRAGEDGELRQIFNASNLMITDSSSAAFEMAFMKKPVLYYQFDMEKMWSGDHTASRGYFKYEDNGFGPVCFKEQEIVCELWKIFANNWKLQGKYESRFSIFPPKKKSSCEQVFEELIK